MGEGDRRGGEKALVELEGGRKAIRAIPTSARSPASKAGPGRGQGGRAAAAQPRARRRRRARGIWAEPGQMEPCGQHGASREGRGVGGTGRPGCSPPPQPSSSSGHEPTRGWGRSPACCSITTAGGSLPKIPLLHSPAPAPIAMSAPRGAPSWQQRAGCRSWGPTTLPPPPRARCPCPMPLDLW